MRLFWFIGMPFLSSNMMEVYCVLGGGGGGGGSRKVQEHRAG